MNRPITTKSLTLALSIATLASPAFAVDREWNGGPFERSWQDPSAWSPNGIPQDDEEVVISGGRVRLNLDTAVLDALHVTQGGTLRTNEYLVAVDDGTYGAPFVIDGAGSQVNAYYAFGDVSVYARQLDVQNDGRLELLGGRVFVRGQLLVDGGVVGGNGLIEIPAGGTYRFVNNGVLSPTGFITIQVDAPGAVALGGNGDGIVDIPPGGNLRVDGIMADGGMSGEMILARNTAVEITQPWTLHSITTGPATLKRERGRRCGPHHGCRISSQRRHVQSELGRLDMDAPFTIDTIITINDGVLDLGSETDASGTIMMNGGEITGATLNNELSLRGHGLISTPGHRQHRRDHGAGRNAPRSTRWRTGRRSTASTATARSAPSARTPS